MSSNTSDASSAHASYARMASRESAQETITLRMATSGVTSAPTLLTAASLLRTRPQLVEALRSHYKLQIVRAWEDLLIDIERAAPDMVLVDLDRLVTFHEDDTARTAGERPCPISGQRLVRLLSHQLTLEQTHPAALIVLSALDYAELEELAPDIHALLTPDLAPRQLIAHMDATLKRRASMRKEAEVHINAHLH